MQTTVTELPESRVRVEAEVSTKELDQAVARAAGALGKDLKMPGFRKGHVPTPVVIQRFGRGVGLARATGASGGRWSVDALDEAKIHPVGAPAPARGAPPGPGQPLTFSFEIGVRPTA